MSEEVKDVTAGIKEEETESNDCPGPPAEQAEMDRQLQLERQVIIVNIILAN